MFAILLRFNNFLQVCCYYVLVLCCSWLSAVYGVFPAWTLALCLDKISMKTVNIFSGANKPTLRRRLKLADMLHNPLRLKLLT